MADYLCYHHNDMDGKVAAYQVWKFFKGKCGINPTSGMFIMKGYDDPYNEDDYRGKTVFIVDLSFSMDTINNLFMICESAAQVHWIDHHDSSIECIKNDDLRMKLEGYHNLHYYINNGACGALLTMLFFNCHKAFNKGQYYDIINYNIKIDEKYMKVEVENTELDRFTINIPVYMYLVDQYDRWVYGDNLRPVYFNIGCNMMDSNLFTKEGEFNNFFWYTMISEVGIESMVKDGQTIYGYKLKQAKSNSLSAGYETIINGRLSAFVLNSQEFSSLAIDADIAAKYDLIIVWGYNGKRKKYRYGFYSQKAHVNCAKIAQQYCEGGGGHRGAAGGYSKEILFR